MSVDIEIIPLGPPATWGMFRERWRKGLADETAAMLGSDPILRRLESGEVIPSDQQLTPEFGAFIDISIDNTLSMTWFFNSESLSEAEYLDDFAINLSSHDVGRIAARWVEANTTITVSTHAGRSAREGELFLALVIAIAEITEGFIIISDTRYIDREVGVYTYTELLGAVWTPKPVLPRSSLNRLEQSVSVSVDAHGDLYDLLRRRQAMTVRLEESRIHLTGDKEDIVQVHVLPLGEPPQWGTVRKNWREALSEDRKRLLGTNPALWNVKNLTDVGVQDRIFEVSTMMLDLQFNNEISIRVFDELGDLLERCLFIYDIDKISNEDLNRLAPLWAKRGYFVCVSSGSGRSSEEPALLIALAAALAEAAGGVVVLPNSKYFSLPAGIYTASEFREARWVDE